MAHEDVSAAIKEILTRYRTVAIVGASPTPERPSHRVADFLKKEGFRVIPVTPNSDQVVGEKAYPDLVSVPVPVEVVNIFRRPIDVPPLVDQAIAIGAKVVWMQEGIIHTSAADKARKAGLTVVMDRCMRKELLKQLGREGEI